MCGPSHLGNALSVHNESARRDKLKPPNQEGHTMKREIVSKQYKHKGGFARVEQDRGGHLLVHCSGCRIEEFAGGMAPALAKLTAHVEK